jgi:LysM repeat protein
MAAGSLQPNIRNGSQTRMNFRFIVKTMLIWQKIVVALLAAAILSGTIYFARMISRPPDWERFQTIPWVQYVNPNVGKLKRARDLVRVGKLSEARAVVIRALVMMPKSPVTRQLRDLLGDINTQIFFAKAPSARKIAYTVKSGDALFSIARKLKSSADTIMRVNNLQSALIRPGEKIFVPPLDFTITVDLPRKRVVVQDPRGFFTQYPIADVDLPHSRKPPVKMEVKTKSFWKGGHPVGPNKALSKHAMPRIYLGRTGYVLYGIDENNSNVDSGIEVKNNDDSSASSTAEHPRHGIAMLKDDIAQLEVLIRKGTPVTIIRDEGK